MILGSAIFRQKAEIFISPPPPPPPPLTKKSRVSDELKCPFYVCFPSNTKLCAVDCEMNMKSALICSYEYTCTPVEAEQTITLVYKAKQTYIC